LSPSYSSGGMKNTLQFSVLLSSPTNIFLSSLTEEREVNGWENATFYSVDFSNKFDIGAQSFNTSLKDVIVSCGHSVFVATEACVYRFNPLTKISDIVFSSTKNKNKVAKNARRDEDTKRYIDFKWGWQISALTICFERFLCIGGSKGALVILDLKTDTIVKACCLGTAGINLIRIHLHEDGPRLVVVYNNSPNLRVYTFPEMQTVGLFTIPGKLPFHFSLPGAAAISPNNKWMVVAQYNGIVIYDLRDPTQYKPVKAFQTQEPRSVDWNSTSSLFAFCAGGTLNVFSLLESEIDAEAVDDVDCNDFEILHLYSFQSNDSVLKSGFYRYFITRTGVVKFKQIDEYCELLLWEEEEHYLHLIDISTCKVQTISWKAASKQHNKGKHQGNSEISVKMNGIAVSKNKDYLFAATVDHLYCFEKCGVKTLTDLCIANLQKNIHLWADVDWKAILPPGVATWTDFLDGETVTKQKIIHNAYYDENIYDVLRDIEN